jgi:putative transcriptional regulator
MVMTITRHPSDVTLAAFAAGTLDEGRSLVVSTHLCACPACRAAVRTFERLRGIALADGEGAPLKTGALERALAAISSAEPPSAPARDGGHAEWPGPLSAYPLGSWRRIGGGVQWRSVGVPAEVGTRVFMLKAAPGTRIPHHDHAGLEWTCVLQGAFSHQQGRYGPGDFDEADDSIDHLPVVEDGEECVCIVALQGQIRLRSLIGRLVQPFVRI